MQKVRASNRLLLYMAQGVLVGAVATSATESQALLSPPARSVTLGHLELTASLNGDQPAGIALSNSGRLFVSFPRHDGPVAFTVGEIVNGDLVPFPNAEVNRAAEDRPRDTLLSVQTMQVDYADHLWLLDTGTLHFGQPPVDGAPKLVEIDLNRNRMIRTISIPHAALVPNSALKDFRMALQLGKTGTVFITDSAPGAEALIVLDLSSESAFRRLSGSPIVGTAGDLTPIVGYEPLLEESGGAQQYRAKPWRVGLNALELSADSKALFFSAFTGRRLYVVETANLVDSTIAGDALAASVTDLGDIGMAGHFALDADGALYFMNIEQNGIYKRTSDGRVTAVVIDPRLIWPDTIVIGRDKYLYVTTSQHDLRGEFHHGKDLRVKPYGLYRVFVNASPVVRGKR